MFVPNWPCGTALLFEPVRIVPELPEPVDAREAETFLRLNVSCSGALEACGGGIAGAGGGIFGVLPNPHIIKTP